MSPLTADLPTWLAGRDPEEFALAWVAPDTDPLWEANVPRIGQSGIVRPGFDTSRLRLIEIARGPLQALRRWMHWEDEQQQLVVISTDLGEWRELTPGELAAAVDKDPRTPPARLARLLGRWLHQRSAGAQAELGWVSAGAAWACHMREWTIEPPAEVIAEALRLVEESDQADATRELITNNAQSVAQLNDRLEHTRRGSEALVRDWKELRALTTDVPGLQEAADWLLDQIALRDRDAQRLRAVLEPDITDYLLDRRAAGPGPEPRGLPLDPQRAAQLALARRTVRDYTAAHYGGNRHDAQALLATFPVGERSLATTGPAAAWRSQSFLARAAVRLLHEQQQTTWDQYRDRRTSGEKAAMWAAAEENSPDHIQDPDLIWPTLAYLYAREAQTQNFHDAMGRLAFPTPTPALLPEAYHQRASESVRQRLLSGLGSIPAACQALDGQIAYLRQQPVPHHRQAETPREVEHLLAVRSQLDQISTAVWWEYADGIAERTNAIMERPTTGTPAAPEPRAPSGAEQDQTQHRRPPPAINPGLR